LYVIINFILLIYQFKRILEFVKTHIKLFLLIEGIFLVFFLGCVIIRMYNPDLTGAEKEADFTFINAILHSKTFPPKDTWFAGSSINYYYFGYLIWATVVKLSGIIAPIGFNLALATTVALTATGAFGLVYHFTKRVSYSIVSSLFLSVLGNLDGLAQIFTRQGYPLPFDWWRSSRVIPDTINEFPYFSFLLGDLHAHFMSIPFVLLLLGLLSQFVSLGKGGRVYPWILLSFISLSLGGAAVINGWDYPTYLIIAGLCVCISVLRGAGATQPGDSKIVRILTGLGMLVCIVVLSRISFWPFYRHFTPQLNFSNLRFVASTQRTGIGYFLIIYGFFLWIILFFIYCRFHWFFTPPSEQENKAKLVYWNSIVLVSVLAYLTFFTWVLPLSCIVSGVFLYLWYKESLSHNQQSTINNQQSTTPYLFLFMAFAITEGCEMIYIKDFYGHPLERQNTIFKFYYQAWILLSIGTPYLLYRILHNKWEVHRKLRQSWIAVLVLFCCACCIYPVFATYEKTNHFRGEAQGGLLYIPTLNGISYIAYRYPFEYEALMWIQENIDEDAIILEATGKPYSFFGRVATTTGRSTVLGWGNHEALWRGQTWKSITQRTVEIKRIYETVNKQKIVELLQKHQINYIYVGRLEKETYNAEGLETFGRYFTPVFENTFVKIYKIP